MTSKLKSKIIVDFNNDLNKIKGAFIKKCSSSLDFSTNNKDKLKKFIYSPKNIREYFYYDHLLGSHFVHFYELRDNILSFCLSFPYESDYDDYETLKDKTMITVNLNNNYDRKEKKSTLFSYSQFKKVLDNYLYFAELFKEYGLFENTNKSPNVLRVEHFSLLFFENKNDILNFEYSFKRDEALFLNILEKKKNFVDKKRISNRAKKDAKKRNKGSINVNIKNNESEIRSLQKQIRKLEKQNKSLKENFGYENAKEDHEMLLELHHDYENSFKTLTSEKKREMRTSKFINIYQQIIEY